MTLTADQIAEDEEFRTRLEMHYSAQALIRAMPADTAYQLMWEALGDGHDVNPYVAPLSMPPDSLYDLLGNPWKDCDGSCARLVLTASAGRPAGHARSTAAR